ncbi:MAG: hypothetical protein WBG50_26160, partial [Desulfomonilaceae bacterium]
MAGHLPVQVPTLYHKARYCTRPFLPKTGKLTPATIIKVRNASQEQTPYYLMTPYSYLQP